MSESSASLNHEQGSDSYPSLSYESEFLLWLLTLWKESLSLTEQISVSRVIHSLETSDFFEHLTGDDSESKSILKAWNYVRSKPQLYLNDPDLANFVPYGLLRVEDKLDELTQAQLPFPDVEFV